MQNGEHASEHNHEHHQHEAQNQIQNLNQNLHQNHNANDIGPAAVELPPVSPVLNDIRRIPCLRTGLLVGGTAALVAALVQGFRGSTLVSLSCHVSIFIAKFAIWTHWRTYIEQRSETHIVMLPSQITVFHDINDVVKNIWNLIFDMSFSFCVEPAFGAVVIGFNVFGTLGWCVAIESSVYRRLFGPTNEWTNESSRIRFLYDQPIRS